MQHYSTALLQYFALGFLQKHDTHSVAMKCMLTLQSMILNRFTLRYAHLDLVAAMQALLSLWPLCMFSHGDPYISFLVMQTSL